VKYSTPTWLNNSFFLTLQKYHTKMVLKHTYQFFEAILNIDSDEKVLQEES